MRLLVHPAARRELDAALRWSEVTFGRLTATRLLRRFEQVGQMLTRQPALGTVTEGPVRKLRLGRFPYTLVYRVQGDLITVIAVAHEGRAPGYWRGR